MKVTTLIRGMALFTAAIFSLSPSPIIAQDIKVLEQAGKSADNYKETTVVFETKGGSNVDVYQLLSQSTAVAFGAGGSASAYGVETKFLCTAPAKLLLPGGVHSLRISTNAMLGTEFRVSAEGGTQYWRVSDPNFVKFIGGWVGFGVGFPVGLIGIANGDAAPAVIGVVCLASGIWLLLTSSANADLERVEP